MEGYVPPHPTNSRAAQKFSHLEVLHDVEEDCVADGQLVHEVPGRGRRIAHMLQGPVVGALCSPPTTHHTAITLSAASTAKPGQTVIKSTLNLSLCLY